MPPGWANAKVTEKARAMAVESARATAKLVEGVGGKVAGFGFIIELTFLPGRAGLEDYPVESLIRY